MKLLLALALVVATATACPVSSLVLGTKTGELAGVLATADFKVCVAKATVGMLDKDDFCGDSSCSKVSNDVLKILGVTGGEKKFADCPNFEKVGKMVDDMIAQKAKLCSLSKLDIACELSTYKIDTAAVGIVHEPAQCSVGLRSKFCEAKDGMCKSKTLQCPGDSTKAIIKSTFVAAVDACSEDIKSDGCKAALKKCIALLRKVVPETVPGTAAEVKKAAARGICFAKALNELKEELKAAIKKEAVNGMEDIATKFKAGTKDKFGDKLKIISDLMNSGTKSLDTMATDAGLTPADITAEEEAQTQALEAAETKDTTTKSDSNGATRMGAFAAMASAVLGSLLLL